jgi:hypothetical protein
MVFAFFCVRVTIWYAYCGCSVATRFEVWLILTHRLLNQEKGLYTSAQKVLSIEEMLKLHDAAYVEQVFNINKRIRALNLNFEEACTLGAFVMMSPGIVYAQVRPG